MFISIVAYGSCSFDIGKKSLNDCLNSLAMEFKLPFEMLLEVAFCRPRLLPTAKPKMKFYHPVPQPCSFLTSFSSNCPHKLGKFYIKLQNSNGFHSFYDIKMVSMGQQYRYKN